jgi:hypothetical protein
VGNPKGRRAIHLCTYKDNIKMNLKETGCSDIDWIHVAQHRGPWRALRNTVTNLQVA